MGIAQVESTIEANMHSGQKITAPQAEALRLAIEGDWEEIDSVVRGKSSDSEKFLIIKDILYRISRNTGQDYDDEDIREMIRSGLTGDDSNPFEHTYTIFPEA